MSEKDKHKRYFFHSFPRPRADETEDMTLERGLAILAGMKKIGLVLAPEIVDWDVEQITGGREELKLLQRRASFTELSDAELPAHSKIFGPISLSFDIRALREAGATPVIYIPQGVANSALSQVGAFCVRGAYHTRYVLRQLQGLKENSDPQTVSAAFGQPVAPDYKLKLQNTDATGRVIASYDVAASDVKNMLQHVGYNNIPFDHSTAMLTIFMSMFYPTDNTHTGDELAYYRQREWRLIAGEINVNNRPLGRLLSPTEVAEVEEIDPNFWTRHIVFDGKKSKRSELALVYEPVPNWNFFDLVEGVIVSKRAAERVKGIVGDKPVQVLAAA
jgi:hypothetical protein